MLSNPVKAMVGLAGLAFLLAVVITLGMSINDIPAEAFSRASNNLALLAIAWIVVDKHSG